MQSPVLGVFYMMLFGLGTVPMMTAVVYANSFINLPFRNKFKKAIPYVAVLIGLLFILRGLGLGILMFLQTQACGYS
jgi:sulfite exporter TauE/SafE